MKRAACLAVALVALAACTASGFGPPGTTREEIRFASGALMLAGTLTLPSGDGPHPAIVCVHGSRHSTRTDFRDYVALLSRAGIAVLSYDKRGCGASEGDLELASFDALAADVSAAVQWLAARDDIDGARIGLLGTSQGGWIAPLAASRNDGIALVVAVSAPATPPFEQTLHVLRRGLEDEGVPKVDADAFLEDVPRWWRYWSSDRSDHAALAARLERWRGSRALEVAVDAGLLVDHLTPPEDLPPFDELRVPPSLRSGDHDPLPVLRRLRVPVLFVYGGDDPLVPAASSARELRRVLTQAEHPDWRVEVFPGSDHGIRVRRGPDLLFRPRFAPAYAELLARWLGERGIRGGEPEAHGAASR